MKNSKKINEKKKTRKKNDYTKHRLIKNQISKKKISCKSVISKSYPKYSRFLGCGSNGCALDSCLDMKCKDKIVVKIAKLDGAFNILKKNGYNYNHPNFIEISFLKKFNNYLEKNMTPHLMYYSGYFFCNENVKNYLVSSANSNNKITTAEEFSEKLYNKKYIVHFVEKADNDLWNYLKNNELTFELWRNIFFQICYTLTLIQYYNPGFRHNDLKPDNILIKFTKPKKNTYIKYIILGKSFYVPDLGISIKIWDFDFSNSNKYKNDKVSDPWCRYLGINSEYNPVYDLHFLLNNIFTYFIKDTHSNDLFDFFSNYLQTKDQKLVSLFNNIKIDLSGYGYNGEDLNPLNNNEIEILKLSDQSNQILINSFRLVDRVNGISNLLPNDLLSPADFLIESNHNLFGKYLNDKNSKIVKIFDSKIKNPTVQTLNRKDLFNKNI